MWLNTCEVIILTAYVIWHVFINESQLHSPPELCVCCRDRIFFIKEKFPVPGYPVEPIVIKLKNSCDNDLRDYYH
jgi:hypothetical protein